jgi:transcriptional regulator with XRE-family HTH domain
LNVIRLNSDMAKPQWAINAKDKMKAKGLTQAKLLDLFEVTTAGAVGHYFNGVREPKVQHMISLAEKLDVPIAELLGVSEGEYSLKQSDETHLTDALRFLSSTVDLKESEICNFFHVYQKIGAKNIIKATQALSQAGDHSSAQMDAVISIQEFMKKAS